MRDIDIKIRNQFVDNYYNSWSDADKQIYNDALNSYNDAASKEVYADAAKYNSCYNNMVNNAQDKMSGDLAVEYDTVSSDLKNIDKILKQVQTGEDGWFKDGSYEGLGNLYDIKDKDGNIKDKGLITLQAEAKAEGKTDIADGYQDSIDKLQSIEKEQNSLKEIALAKQADVEHRYDGQQATLDLAEAYKSGDNAAISAATDKYMKWQVEDFEKNSENLRSGINSQADAKAYEDKMAEIKSFKEALGISEPKTSEVKETAINSQTVDFNNKPVEAVISGSKLNAASVTAAAATITATTSAAKNNKQDEDNDKPNPYAFEKPVQPSGMPSSDYEKYCKAAEEKHISEINNKIADEIWTKGNWGNGQERVDKLTAAGYDVSAIQGVLNDKVAGINKSNTSVVKETVQSDAQKTKESSQSTAKETIIKETTQSAAQETKEAATKSTFDADKLKKAYAEAGIELSPTDYAFAELQSLSIAKDGLTANDAAEKANIDKQIAAIIKESNGDYKISDTRKAEMMNDTFVLKTASQKDKMALLSSLSETKSACEPNSTMAKQLDSTMTCLIGVGNNDIGGEKKRQDAENTIKAEKASVTAARKLGVDNEVVINNTAAKTNTPARTLSAAEEKAGIVPMPEPYKVPTPEPYKVPTPEPYKVPLPKASRFDNAINDSTMNISSKTVQQNNQADCD